MHFFNISIQSTSVALFYFPKTCPSIMSWHLCLKVTINCFVFYYKSETQYMVVRVIFGVISVCDNTCAPSIDALRTTHGDNTPPTLKKYKVIKLIMLSMKCNNIHNTMLSGIISNHD